MRFCNFKEISISDPSIVASIPVNSKMLLLVEKKTFLTGEDYSFDFGHGILRISLIC